MPELHSPDSASPSAETAEKIRSGEFFRESRAMYDLYVHDPMTERYWYILITTMALLIVLAAFFAAQALLPLQRSVPFIVSTGNILEDVPHIKTLLAKEGEEPGEALLRFLGENYVMLRESYDIDTFDRDVSGIKSQSSDEVMAAFKQAINPSNPESPITQYQRHSKRSIEILSAGRVEGRKDEMEVVYEATVESRTEIKKSTWKANITFRYGGIQLDEETGKVKPVQFMVTDYRTKPE